MHSQRHNTPLKWGGVSRNKKINTRNIGPAEEAGFFNMKYVSTEKNSSATDFGNAIFVGMAPDGGLYVPESVPVFTKRELDELPGKSLHEVATLTLHKWLHGDFDKSEIEKMVDEVLNFPLPLIDVGGYKVLELFHGPTYSFSDIRRPMFKNAQ